MDSAIEASGLTKQYGSRRGLDNVSLTVRTGEIFGYLGPNGAGKTTTIRLLLDLIRPTSGKARVLGMDPIRSGVEVRRRVGFLPGELTLEGRDTAMRLLKFLGELRGGVSEQRLRELADRLDVDLSLKVSKMSKGNKQKVGLIQAFMHDPALLILDEPTSGLDPLMQQVFLAMVREARAAGQTVFMSSHILAEVQEVADRVGFVREGKLVAVEEVSALQERAVRTVELHFDMPVPPERFTSLPGTRDVIVDGSMVRCVIDGKPDPLIKAAAEFTVVDLVSTAPDLEGIFMTFYMEGPADVVA